MLIDLINIDIVKIENDIALGDLYLPVYKMMIQSTVHGCNKEWDYILLRKKKVSLN